MARNRQGEYVASTEAIGNDAKAPQGATRATLYTAFYHAALEQHIPAETILKLLRVHSYDVDFKQKVKAGDTFEMFFDGGNDEEVGELLYTSMTIDGQNRKFYRFRTPDDVVDYYDEQGNSAKKFLMRNPVKGGRYTSGFGDRRHPLLKYQRMHTGVDWAAPSGTPILAAGDGTVEKVGREGGYGNYVRSATPTASPPPTATCRASPPASSPASPSSRARSSAMSARPACRPGRIATSRCWSTPSSSTR